MRILVPFGTRPEAIKLFPVIQELVARGADVRPLAVVQQEDLLIETVESVGLQGVEWRPFFVGGIQSRLSSCAINGIGIVSRELDEWPADMVVVQGDTATAYAGAVAGHYHAVAVAHVEAGLRTHDLAAPFPEEAHRQMIDRLAALLFAPTWGAAQSLKAEALTGRVLITGNTEIDALRIALADGWVRFAQEPYVVATAHRRESFGRPLESICLALDEIAKSGARVIFVVHPNPEVGKAVAQVLGGSPVECVPPIDYMAFARLIAGARLILTDSGGIQECAPAINVPCLVLRDKTERKEAIDCGANRLVGTDRGAIVRAAMQVLRDDAEHQRMASAPSPYGDGRASMRIAAAILGQELGDGLEFSWLRHRP